MKKHFGIFASSADCQTAVDSLALVKPYVAYIEDGNYIDWNTKSVDYGKMPLTFEILSGGNIYWKYTSYNDSGARTIQYSKNGGEWTSITAAKDDSVYISTVSGDILQFKSDNGSTSDNSSVYNYFANDANVRFNMQGNVYSLLSSSAYTSITSIGNFCLMYVFQGIGVVNAENLKLPATTLATCAYAGMFRNCNNLITAPELPATTLGIQCYIGMFSQCKNLTKAPDLLYTGAVPGAAYYNMFSDCKKLNYVKCLATDVSADAWGSKATGNWLYKVASTGTFVKHPDMNDWETGGNGIPTNWTVIDAVL